MVGGMKVHFSELFSVQDGMVQPKTPVHINGVTMGPGVFSGAGVSFGGVDLTQFIGRHLEVERMSNGVYDIKGYYN